MKAFMKEFDFWSLMIAVPPFDTARDAPIRTASCG
jgi:hypothetical protein